MLLIIKKKGGNENAITNFELSIIKNYGKESLE